MNGGDLLVRMLAERGADSVFGLPGTQNLPLFEGLRKGRCRTILASTELGAAFMANGYYRASGRPGVFTTISGPGFTWALTGIAEARHDSAALIQVVVKAPGDPSRQFNLQDIDQKAIASSLVKRYFQVREPSDLAESVSQAWSASLAGEPGPVIIEVEPEVLTAEVGSAGAIEAVATMDPGLDSDPDSEAVDLTRAASQVSAAGKVLFILGQGASEAAPWVARTAEEWNAAVVSTSSGRGILPEDHLRSLCGDFSGWGTDLVNQLVGEADLILALGCKFTHNGSSGFRLRVPPEKLVRVDTSEEVLRGNYPADVMIRGSVEDTLQELLQVVQGRPGSEGGWTPESLEGWKHRFRAKRHESMSLFPDMQGSGGPNPLQGLLTELRSLLPRNSILVTDSGLHQLVVRRGFEVLSPRGLILPSDFQSMGFGIPASIGAAFGAPERKVVCVVGDGGFLMTGLEIVTAVREGIDLTVIIFNDGHFGQIRLQQLKDSGVPFSTSLGTVDFSRLASALGASYLALDPTDPSDLSQALDVPGVVIIDVLLRDSSDMAKLRAKGLVKATARRVLGDRGLRILRALKKSLTSGVSND